MGSLFKKLFKKKIDQSSCYYCKTPFNIILPGFYPGGNDLDGNDLMEKFLQSRVGCDSCGVPVCFTCAAHAADRNGMHGQCICPKCGAKLD